MRIIKLKKVTTVDKCIKTFDNETTANGKDIIPFINFWQDKRKGIETEVVINKYIMELNMNAKIRRNINEHQIS